jgi:tetratricopeptide (TPR) repeat protein
VSLIPGEIDRARMAAAIGDLVGLREALFTLVLLEPLSVLLAQARILLDQGRGAEALAMMAGMPALPEGLRRDALVARCQALIAVDRPAEAAGLLQEALAARAAAEPDLLTTLARGLFRSGEVAMAEAILEAVLPVLPDHFETRYGAGVLRLAQGRLSEAMPHLAAAQRINPRRPEPYQAMARAWRLSGQAAHGAAMVESVMAESPLVAAPGLARELVELYAASGDDEGRIRWLRRLESAARLEAGHRLELARHWLDLGMTGELHRLLIGLSEEDEAVRHLLAGMIAELEGEDREALGHALAAAELEGELWLVQVRLARALLQLGAAADAVRPHITAAEAAAGQHPEVRLLSAIFAVVEGRGGEAEASLRALAGHGGVWARLREEAAGWLAEL